MTETLVAYRLIRYEGSPENIHRVLQASPVKLGLTFRSDGEVSCEELQRVVCDGTLDMYPVSKPSIRFLRDEP